jgi:hypothetical protein
MKKLLPWVLIGILSLNPFWLGTDLNVVPTDHHGIRVAQGGCCHCYSYLSSGKRFYHGVVPISSCLAQGNGAHCEGESPCQ